MPRPNVDPIDLALTSPSYEAEVRAMANFLDNKTLPLTWLPGDPIPVVAVTISSQCAKWIAAVMRTHADNHEARHG